MPGNAKPKDAKRASSKAKTTAAKGSRKKAHAKPTAKAQKGAAATGVKLLSGGNPQIPKGEGDAPVQAYIAAMPGWKRDVGKRLDAIITRAVPGVKKAVKWNSPFYGVEGQGWFAAVHVYTHYVQVTFFQGAALRPLPPKASKHKDVRYVDIPEGGLDDGQMAAWMKQAAARPGWSP